MYLSIDEPDEREQRAGWAPGYYQCICNKCKKLFTGDKRAFECADCAYGDEDDIEASDSKNYLEHVLRSAYLFVLAESDGYVSSIGTEEMSDMLMHALCNEFGCERFSNWVESRIEE